LWDTGAETIIGKSVQMEFLRHDATISACLGNLKGGMWIKISSIQNYYTTITFTTIKQSPMHLDRIKLPQATIHTEITTTKLCKLLTPLQDAMLNVLFPSKLFI